MAGIIDTVKFAGVLVLAIPAALAGLEFLLVRGEPLIGGALLVLATVLVLSKRLLPSPSLGGAIGSRLERRLVDDHDED